MVRLWPEQAVMHDQLQKLGASSLCMAGGGAHNTLADISFIRV